MTVLPRILRRGEFPLGAPAVREIRPGAGPLPAPPIPENRRAAKSCQKPFARPVSALPTPIVSRPIPMISRRLIRSTRREIGRLAIALKAAAANPTMRLTCVSVSPRSILIGWTSSPISALLPKRVMTVRPNIVTPYQARRELGQGCCTVVAAMGSSGLTARSFT